MPVNAKEFPGLVCGARAKAEKKTDNQRWFLSISCLEYQRLVCYVLLFKKKTSIKENHKKY